MKKNIKKIIAAFLIITSTSIFAAAKATKKSIVCTSFPEYDWIQNILGNKAENFELTLLQNNGTDLHSYQPSFKDILKITTCHMFVYIGGESDEWVEKVLTNSKNKDQIWVNLLDTLGTRVLEEEIVEGMEAEEESKDEKEAPEYDEHIWLSLRNAVYLTQILSGEIQKLDPDNKDFYTETTNTYVKKLTELDSLYSKTVASAKYNTLVFADRFPFRYLTEDYGLNYYAAFVGCSAESEASFKTLAFLSNKIDSLEISSVLVLEKNNKKMAKTVVSNTKNKNQKILELDSLQSITQKDIYNKRNYISVMEKNLETLKQALN